MDIERLIALIEANTKSYERAMVRVQQQTDRALRGAERSFGRLDGIIAGVGKTAATFLGVAGVQQLGRFVVNIINDVARIGDVSDRLGIAAGLLQELAFTAKQADVDFNALTSGLEIFVRNLGTASTGAGDLDRILKANGVSLRDVEGNMRSTQEILFDFANLIQNAASDQERNVLATEAFGRSGQDLIPILVGGAQALRENGQAARDLGAILGDELVDATQVLNDQWDAFTSVVMTGTKVAILNLIDTIGALINKFRELGPAALEALGVATGARPGFGAQTGALAGATPEELAAFALRNMGAPGPSKGFDPNEFLGVSTSPLNPVKPTVLPSLGGGGGGSEEDRIAKVIEQLEFEQAQLVRTNLEQEIYNELKAAGVDINSEAGLRISDLVTAIEAETAAMTAAGEAAEHLRDTWQEIGERAWGAIEAIATGAQRAEEAVVGLVRSLLLAIAKAQFLKALEGMQSAGGFWGSIATGLANAVNPRAAGGPAFAGMPHTVGEHGRELFVPKVSGNVMSHSSLMGMLNKSQPLIQIVSPPGTRARQRETRQGGRQGIQILFDAINEGFVGGAFDEAVGQRFGTQAIPNRRA